MIENLHQESLEVGLNEYEENEGNFSESVNMTINYNWKWNTWEKESVQTQTIND